MPPVTVSEYGMSFASAVPVFLITAFTPIPPDTLSISIIATSKPAVSK